MDTALGAVIVAAVAVAVNAGTSIWLHFRRAAFEEALANRKFSYDVALAERKAALDALTADQKSKQELAGEILTAFYEVQRMMPAIRSPASWGDEGKSRPRIEGKEQPELERSRDAYYVVVERINKHREAIARFMGKQYSAMALFGGDAAKPFEALNELLSAISTAAHMLIHTAGQEPQPPQHMKWRAAIWAGYGEDEIQTQLDEVAKDVRALCEPILLAKPVVLSEVGSSNPVSWSGVMNWKRGLFRAWLVSSALWSALWVLLNWSGIAASRSDLACLVSNGSSGPWCAYRLQGDIAVGGLEDWHFWVGLVVPPFALLLLGYILLWIARGFRREPSHALIEGEQPR
jgi:hypothetical protein